MPATKKAAKKSTAKKSATKKGGGAKRGAGSSTASIGTAAGGLGRKKDLRVLAGRNAGIKDIQKALERALGLIGCRGCRSGIDRIVFDDIVLPGGFN